MVCAPATNVNVTLFVSPMPVSPTAAIVALPFQVPANAAGIVAPLVAGEGDVLCDTAAAGLLAVPASELPPESAREAGGDPWVSSTTARTTMAAATAPAATRIGVRRDRAGAWPGTDSWVGARPGTDSCVGTCPGNVGPAGGYTVPVCRAESARASACGPAGGAAA